VDPNRCSEKLPSPRSLPANAAWSVAGNIAYVTGRFLIILLMTRFFTPEQVGQIIFALAVATPASFFFNMEVRSVYVTDTAESFNVGHALAFRQASNLIFLVVILVGCLAVGGLHPAQNLILIVLAALVRSVESWADVYLAVFQKNERMSLWAVSQFLKTALVLLWVWLIAGYTQNIAWILVGWGGGTLLIVLVFDRLWAHRITPIHIRWEPKPLFNLARGAFPLGLFVTVSILNSWIAAYFIKHNLDYAAVAYFGVLLNYVNGLSSIQNGINQAVLPRWALYYAHHRRKFWKLLAVVLAGAWGAILPLIAVVLWRGRWILATFHKPEYADYADLFALMIVAAGVILTGMILGDAVLAARRFKSRLLAVSVGLAANILACLLLIPRWQLLGAAWAVIISAVAIVLVCAVLLTPKRRDAYSERNLNSVET
jgi:O-antigen/teichoic acid export membrane protein